jgi:uncharacterized hydrophobic protein (TIGR00341 family)
MSLRLIEIHHKEGKAEEIDFLVKDLPLLETWHDYLASGGSITKILIKSDNTETVLDMLESFFSKGKPPRIVILPVEATLPRPEEPEKGKEEERSLGRISTEELYQKMLRFSGVSQRYIVMAVLASFVAAIGLLKNDAAVIIGSMVIAPLLGPNMALSLATALADFKLARKAIITNILGFTLVLSISILMGLFMKVDPAIPQIAARSDVSNFYIFIALATGVAGAYSIAAGVAEALVGVMVAVALLPPLAAAGLLLGAGYWMNATGALLLVFVNVVSINLSGVITFILKGIQPKNWWEAKSAKKAVRIAITLWITMLLILGMIIFFEEQIITAVR